MKHPERVEDYLAHIVEAIGRATSYVEPLQDLEAFRRNPQVQDASFEVAEELAHDGRADTPTDEEQRLLHPIRDAMMEAKRFSATCM
jgi:hypothetical protein